jgi:ribosomal RNA assembly protein
MFKSELRISKQRLAVLIGEKGKTKREIESKTKTRITVDSEEGDVVITGDDSLQVFLTEKIVRAIGRGFNPVLALKLLNENNCIEIIQIKQFTGKSRKKQIRLKGRIIGQEGKARRLIEEITNTDISIYGKTCSIIGSVETVPLAKRAIEALLSGAPHGPIYKALEQRMRELRT